MRDRRRAAAFFFFFRRRKIEDAYVFFYSEKTCAANLCYVVLVRPFSKVMRTSQLVSNLALDSYPTTSRTSANGDHARSFRSARVRVQLRDLAYSSCEDPLTRPLGRGGTSREIRDVTRGWCASGRPLVCSRVGDRIETGRPGAKFKKCERDGAAPSARRGFLVGGEKDRPERTDPTRARVRLPALTRHPAEERACPRVYDQNQRCVKSHSQSPSRSPPRRPQTRTTASDLAFRQCALARGQDGRSPTARASRNTRNGVHAFHLSTCCDARTCWRARSAACDERARVDPPRPF